MALVGRSAVVQEPSTHRALVFNLNDTAMLIGKRLDQGLTGCVPSRLDGSHRTPSPPSPPAPCRCGHPPSSSPAFSPPPLPPPRPLHGARLKFPGDGLAACRGYATGPKQFRGNELAAASACCCEYDIPGTLPPGPLPPPSHPPSRPPPPPLPPPSPWPPCPLVTLLAPARPPTPHHLVRCLRTIFSLGCALVIAAIFLYGSSTQTPQELCESLGGTWPCAVPKASRDYKEVEASDSEWTAPPLHTARDCAAPPRPAKCAVLGTDDL